MTGGWALSAAAWQRDLESESLIIRHGLGELMPATERDSVSRFFPIFFFGFISFIIRK